MRVEDPTLSRCLILPMSSYSAPNALRFQAHSERLIQVETPRIWDILLLYKLNQFFSTKRQQLLNKIHVDDVPKKRKKMVSLFFSKHFSNAFFLSCSSAPQKNWTHFGKVQTASPNVTAVERSDKEFKRRKLQSRLNCTVYYIFLSLSPFDASSTFSRWKCQLKRWKTSIMQFPSKGAERVSKLEKKIRENARQFTSATTTTHAHAS